MKETFDLLAQLDLKKLNKLKSPADSKTLQKFQEQLQTDFNNNIAPGSFDALKQADNWLKVLKELAIDPSVEINEKSMEKLDKINQLHGGTTDIAFIILDMYQAIDTVLRDAAIKAEREANIIKSVLIEYKDHLQDKLKNEGLEIISVGDKETIKRVDEKEALTSKQEKLIGRYQAIATLEQDFSTKKILGEEDLTKAKSVYEVCLSNKPDWSERPFLQKLTDVLSLGFKPLYRTFVSKETELQGKLDNELKGPSLGG